jgi:hypothetical protein
LDGISSAFEEYTKVLSRKTEVSRFSDQLEILTGNCFDSIDAADLGFVDRQQLLQIFSN